MWYASLSIRKEAHAAKFRVTSANKGKKFGPQSPTRCIKKLKLHRVSHSYKNQSHKSHHSEAISNKPRLYPLATEHPTRMAAKTISQKKWAKLVSLQPHLPSRRDPSLARPTSSSRRAAAFKFQMVPPRSESFRLRSPRLWPWPPSQSSPVAVTLSIVSSLRLPADTPSSVPRISRSL